MSIIVETSHGPITHDDANDWLVVEGVLVIRNPEHRPGTFTQRARRVQQLALYAPGEWKTAVWKP